MRTIKAITGAASAALLISSMAAAAATTAAETTVATEAPAPNAWMMLSVLSSPRSVTLGGAAAVAQSADVPSPPPEMYGAAGGPLINGEVAAIFLWFGLIALALTTSGSGGVPNSPN